MILSNKIIIVSGYLIILVLMAIAIIQHFNFMELLRFILFWAFLTALAFPTFSNAKDASKSLNKDNDDFFSVKKLIY